MKYQTVIVGVSGEVYRSDETEDLTEEQVVKATDFFQNIQELQFLTMERDGRVVTFNPDNIECIYLDPVQPF